MAELVVIDLRRIDLLKDLLRCLRHKGHKERRARLDAVAQVVENCCETVSACRILRELPRFSLIDILVAALEEVEDLRHSVRHAELVDLCLNLRDRTCDDRLEIVVDSVLIRHALVCDLAAEIFVAHRNRAVYEIAERIRKLGVPSLDHEVVGDHAVILKRHLVDAEVADRVDVEYIGEIVGVNDISLGL